MIVQQSVGEDCSTKRTLEEEAKKTKQMERKKTTAPADSITHGLLNSIRRLKRRSEASRLHYIDRGARPGLKESADPSQNPPHEYLKIRTLMLASQEGASALSPERTNERSQLVRYESIVQRLRSEMFSVIPSCSLSLERFRSAPGKAWHAESHQTVVHAQPSQASNGQSVDDLE